MMTMIGFCLLGLIAAGLYVASRLRLGGLMRLGDLVDVVRTSTVGRLVLVACWAWLGWHLLAR
jgi:hypothetical protein